jgi:hypothetical protein
MGLYFEAFHQTGFYYPFVGLAQILAGALLLVRRTALLGAVLYLPIITNIAVLTVATQFGGTAWLTVLMGLACVGLLVWDGHRLVGIVSAPAMRRGNEPRLVEPAVWDLWTPRAMLAAPDQATGARWLIRGAYLGAFIGALVATLVARGLLPISFMKLAFVVVPVAGVITLAGVFWGRYRLSQVGAVVERL